MLLIWNTRETFRFRGPLNLTPTKSKGTRLRLPITQPIIYGLISVATSFQWSQYCTNGTIATIGIGIDKLRRTL